MPSALLVLIVALKSGQIGPATSTPSPALAEEPRRQPSAHLASPRRYATSSSATAHCERTAYRGIADTAASRDARAGGYTSFSMRSPCHTRRRLHTRASADVQKRLSRRESTKGRGVPPAAFDTHASLFPEISRISFVTSIYDAKMISASRGRHILDDIDFKAVDISSREWRADDFPMMIIRATALARARRLLMLCHDARISS